METRRHEAHVEAKAPPPALGVLTPVNAHRCPGTWREASWVLQAPPTHTHLLSGTSQCLALGPAGRRVGEGRSHGRALLPAPPGLLGGRPGGRLLAPCTRAAGYRSSWRAPWEACSRPKPAASHEPWHAVVAVRYELLN